MKSINEILYPIEVGNKHPYTKEIIKLAEGHGINLTDIANLMGCSQPNVSQLKAGDRLAKVIDLEPLIQLLSPTLPGEEFHTYTVVKNMTPELPEYWEEEVLLTGLRDVSQKSTNGRYPQGDDTFHEVEKAHYEALEREQSKIGAFLYSVSANKIESTQRRLKDNLNLYLQEQESVQAREEKDQEDLRGWVTETINNLTYMRDPLEKVAIEEKLMDLYERQFFKKYPMPESYIKANLLEECNFAANLLNIPLIRSTLKEGEYESYNVNSPEKHAQNIIERIEQVLLEADKEITKKKNKYRLKGLFQRKALESIKSLKLRDPRESISWKDISYELFGSTVCKVFKASVDDSYEVNLTDSFLLWSDKIKYKIEQEDIQICGPLLISKHINESLIDVHELHSKKFVVIHSFNTPKFNKKLSIISEPLDTEKLFEHLNLESKKSGWSNEMDLLLSELKSTLSTRGYRVQGVRPIY